MRISAILLCAVVVPVCWGQQETSQITKIVRVRGNAQLISNAACAYSPVHCSQTPFIHAIVLKGQPLAVTEMEKTIRELDGIDSSTSATGKSVETTVYVIAGSAELIPGTQDVTSEALSPVVKQLRPIFPYAHYQLLGTMLLRSAQGASGAASGIMKSVLTQPDVSQPSDYKITYDQATLSPDPPTTIELKKFEFSVSVPVLTGSLKHESNAPYATTQYQRSKVGIQVDIDLRESQKVVVGKANVGDSDTCFFIVLSARLVP